MKIAIRADGSTAIGMGHIYNSLAIADVLREKGAEIYFITRDYAAAVQKLQERGYHVEKIAAGLKEKDSFDKTINILDGKDTKFLITDLLVIHHDCSAELRKRGIKSVSFDILGNIALQSDIIFNRTTLTKRFSNYKDNGYTQYYLGPKYVPLAKQYWGLKNKKREIREVKKVLVCLGGGDEFNLTTRVAKILDSFPVETTLVLGKAFQGELELHRAMQEMRSKPIILKDIPNMAEIMLLHDLAVCAGGSVLYELAITGTPAMIIPMNDHQVENGEEFQRLGSVISMGMHTDISDGKISEKLQELITGQELRRKMSENGKSITDGKGAERAAKIIYDFVKENE